MHKDFSDNRGFETLDKIRNNKFRIRQNLKHNDMGIGNIVYKESICEFTGLRDFNGIEIYENDYFTDEDEGYKIPVEWNEGQFVINDNNCLTPLFEVHKLYCVMGNLKDYLLYKGEK